MTSFEVWDKHTANLTGGFATVEQARAFIDEIVEANPNVPNLREELVILGDDGETVA